MASKERQQERAQRAAALVAAQRAKERRRRRLSIIGVFALIVVVIGAGFVINQVRDTTKDVEGKAPAIGSKYGVAIGDATAPHKVIIYEDFVCPFCGELEKQTHTKLADLATAGKVQVEYRPFKLLDDYSGRAAAVFGVVLEKSGPDVAKKFHDLLYANQPSEEGPFPSNDKIVDLAVQAGADADTVNAGLADGSGKAWEAAATKQADSIGVQSTPTILLDGKVFQNGRTVDAIADNLISAVS